MSQIVNQLPPGKGAIARKNQLIKHISKLENPDQAYKVNQNLIMICDFYLEIENCRFSRLRSHLKTAIMQIFVIESPPIPPLSIRGGKLGYVMALHKQDTEENYMILDAITFYKNTQNTAENMKNCITFFSTKLPSNINYIITEYVVGEDTDIRCCHVP